MPVPGQSCSGLLESHLMVVMATIVVVMVVEVMVLVVVVAVVVLLLRNPGDSFEMGHNIGHQPQRETPCSSYLTPNGECTVAPQPSQPWKLLHVPC